MPYFSSVARMLLSDILQENDAERAGPIRVSLFDTVVVLIAFTMPACATQARQACHSWLRGKVFPNCHLKAIMERRNSHEVVSMIISPIAQFNYFILIKSIDLASYDTTNPEVVVLAIPQFRRHH